MSAWRGSKGERSVTKGREVGELGAEVLSSVGKRTDGELSLDGLRSFLSGFASPTSVLLKSSLLVVELQKAEGREISERSYDQDKELLTITAAR